MEKLIHSGHRERMRTKLMNTNDSSQMLEHELLEILLFYAQPRKNTNEIAHLLLREFGTLQKVFDADPKDLLLVKGVSSNIAAFIKLFPKMFNIYDRVLQAPLTNVSTTRRLKNYVQPIIREAENENLYVIYIDEKCDAFCCEPLIRGNSIEIRACLEDIILSIQRKGPKAISLAHNHPFGSCIPSQEDIISTIKIKYMLKFMGIEVYDHIIFGNDGYCSIMDIVNEEFNKMLDALDGHNKSYRHIQSVMLYKDKGSAN